MYFVGPLFLCSLRHYGIARVRQMSVPACMKEFIQLGG